MDWIKKFSDFSEFVKWENDGKTRAALVNTKKQETGFYWKIIRTFQTTTLMKIGNGYHQVINFASQVKTSWSVFSMATTNDRFQFKVDADTDDTLMSVFQHCYFCSELRESMIML